MGEALPVVLGVLIGAVFGRRGSRLGVAGGAVLAAAGGLLASAATGELAVSWSYALFDIPLVMAAATTSALILRRLHHRSPGAAT